MFVPDEGRLASLIAPGRIRDGRSRRANSLERWQRDRSVTVIGGSGAAYNTIEEVRPAKCR